MEIRPAMKQLEKQYTPTVLQSALGEPLRSEQRIGEFLPPILSRGDMLVVFIALVLFIPNASIVQATQATGATTYLYWVIGAVTFLLPGAIVTGQLNRFMPVDGAIYVWSHRALGSLWGFFAGFCAWFPGVLLLFAASDTVLPLVQGIGVQVVGVQAKWLIEPWQQGILVLAILLLTRWLSTLPLQLIMRLARGIVLLYGAGIFVVGLAGIVWLLSGHAPQVSPITGQGGFGAQNIVLYSVIVRALLGIEVPLNLAGETKGPATSALFLRWGPILVLAAYLIGTFGVMVAVPQSRAGAPYSTLTAVNIVFGTPAAVLVSITFIAFFILVTVMCNITFARILFVSALDYRLPTALGKVNRYAAPSRSINVQAIIACCFAAIAYFIGPLLYSWESVDLPSEVYEVTQAITTVIWCISMLILFLDLPILLRRFRALLAKKPDQLLAPVWALHLCCIVGGLASLLGIWATLSSSWDNSLIPNQHWIIAVTIVVLILLVIGLVGSAYPRLLSSLEEQTAVARENARLYSELHTAYAKLTELDELKDAFLMTASHELRTPLTIIQGYLELLGEMEENIDPKTRRAFVNKARRACDELILLQANIMDASRIQFDIDVLCCTSISLKEICTSVVDLFEPLLLQERREVEVDVATNITVWADATRLKQILRNLIANALRYSPPKTPIRITAMLEPKQHMVRMNVIDRGSGIPLDKQEAIFDKFVRLERDMHGTMRGSGLGLFITRQLVEAMEGSITVQSSGVSGKGSTFTFTLPIDEPTAKATLSGPLRGL